MTALSLFSYCCCCCCCLILVAILANATAGSTIVGSTMTASTMVGSTTPVDLKAVENAEEPRAAAAYKVMRSGSRRNTMLNEAAEIDSNNMNVKHNFFDENKSSSEEKIEAESRHLHFHASSPLLDLISGTAGLAAPTQPRVELQQIVKEKLCPAEMNLDGDRCIGTKVLPALQMCPPEFEMNAVAGECVARARPLVDCPAGFEFRNGKCFSCEIEPARFVCQSPGEILDPTGKVCVKHVQPPSVCPLGFVNGPQHRCLQRVAPMESCPPGMALNSRRGGGCVRERLVPPNMVCPEGSSLDAAGQQCVTVSQLAPRCPRGFEYDETQETCFQIVNRVPAECPSGFRRLPHSPSCMRIERSGSEAVCPKSFRLSTDESHCLREVVAPTPCPHGFFAVPGNEAICQRVVPEIASCPPGSEPVNSGSRTQCQELVAHRMVETCPPGFQPKQDDAFKCERTERLVPELVCENDCARVFIGPVSFACPDDTVFRDDPVQPKCVRSVNNVQCAQDGAARARCLARQIVSGSTEGEGSSGGAALRALSHYYVIDPGCEAEVSPDCREKAHEEEILAQPYCPGGGIVEGRQCVAREPLLPHRVCRMGKLDETKGECSRRTVVPRKSECPPGTQRDASQDRCISFNILEPILSCPDGAIRGDKDCCVMQVPAEPPQRHVVSLPVARRCLTGILTPSAACAHIERVPLQMTCPAGAKPHGPHCAIEAQMLVLPPVEKAVRPHYVCPDGKPPINGVCRVLESTPSIFVCPEGRKPVVQRDGREMCIVTAGRVPMLPTIESRPAVPVCPEGSEQRGSTCLFSHEVEALRACPTGYQLQPGGEVCLQSSPPSLACPSGSSLSSQGMPECEHEVVSTPTIRIVNGCVHNVADVCQGCPRDVVSVCHRGD